MQLVLERAVAYLAKVGEDGVITVTDREGHILAHFRMDFSAGYANGDIRINEQAQVKARTAAFFCSDFGSFTTLTAGFIINEHFPPGIGNLEGGPLYGVPFSSFPKGVGAGNRLGDGQLQVPSAIVFINGVNAPTDTVDAGNTANRPADQPLVITPLSDDLGGLALHKWGMLPKGRLGRLARHIRGVGGLGVEIDAFGVLGDDQAARSPGRPDVGVLRADNIGVSKRFIEEQAAFAGQFPFKPTAAIQATRVLVNGFRFPYVNKSAAKGRLRPADLVGVTGNLAAFGDFELVFDTDGTERDPDGGEMNPYMTPGELMPFVASPRDTPLQEFPRQGWVPRYPSRDSIIPATGSGGLTEADVDLIVAQAAAQSFRTRGAIRRPIGQPMRIFICVVDLAGNILGAYRTEDATVFSYDVAIQKARTCAFWSTDQVGFTSRAIGFMSQVSYPPGLGPQTPGPLSGLLPPSGNVDPADLGTTDSVVDYGVSPPTSDLTRGSGRLTEISQLLTDNGVNFAPMANPTIVDGALQLLSARMPHIKDGRLSPLQLCVTVDLTLGHVNSPATTIPNAFTIFPGSCPLYKDDGTGQRILVGSVGISGDGVDQDDAAAFAGHKGFEPPVRCDQATEAQVRAALLAGLAKLSGEYPNLDFPGGVIDVTTQRITNSSILQGLRLPYIKLPRSLKL
ncbi:MAG: heme-binding protein [Planctomycetota bacterium]|nr:heme-binding protein [Planctomycetota bacterium]